jgi:hypothetical protein
MLWDASAIRGYAIAGIDGHIGTVSDFLLDDTSWRMRWLVIDVGHWFPRREVLLPASVLGHPDAVRRELPVRATMRQVKESSDIAAHLPVSRQMEIGLYDHYAWDPYWNSIGEGAIAPLASATSDREAAQHDPDDAALPADAGDPHLRSVKAMIGHHIHATDGEIGHAEDFLIDDDGWIVRYIKVNTENWWPGNRVLISPRSIRQIDWEEKLVNLDVNRRKVKKSPPYDPSTTVDGAYEETFLTYYGIRWVQP